MQIWLGGEKLLAGIAYGDFGGIQVHGMKRSKALSLTNLAQNERTVVRD